LRNDVQKAPSKSAQRNTTLSQETCTGDDPMKTFTSRGFTATQLGLTGLALIYLVACGGPRNFNLAPASARSVVKDAPEWLFEVPQTDT